jgi:hypothetical protein
MFLMGEIPPLVVHWLDHAGTSDPVPVVVFDILPVLSFFLWGIFAGIFPDSHTQVSPPRGGGGGDITPI